MERYFLLPIALFLGENLDLTHRYLLAAQAASLARAALALLVDQVFQVGTVVLEVLLVDQVSQVGTVVVGVLQGQWASRDWASVLYSGKPL